MTTANNNALLSTEGTLILCAYILTLIGIGWLGKKAQKEKFDVSKPMFKSGGKVEYDNYLPAPDDMDY